METPTQQPIELHCRAILHLSPEQFTIREDGKELLISILQPSEDSPDMAELTVLREELGMPRCSADIFYKANTIYFKPHYQLTVNALHSKMRQILTISFDYKFQTILT